MVDSTTCPRCEQEYDASEPACPACGRLAAAAPCARHPDRAAEGRCVICGAAVCDDCNDSDRPHFSCPDHREIPVIQGWAQVYTTGDDVEAGLIKENLQSEGIDAAVLSQKDRTFAVELGDLSPVRVLVPAYEYGTAREIIAAHMDASGEVSFACPQCGEPYEGGESVCPSCGHPLR